jgi:hypothetical protein
VGESPAAGLAVAERLGAGGTGLADAVRSAFTDGLSSAMVAGAVVAALGAAFILWRAPRRTIDIELEAIELEGAEAFAER